MRGQLMDANNRSLGKLYAQWRNEIDGMYQVAEYDRKAAHELINEFYRKKMNGFDSQKSYDKVAAHYHKILFLTRAMYIHLKRYRADLERNIEEAEKTGGNRCPCCGQLLDEYFFESLREQSKDAENQLIFYETFVKFRQEEFEEIRKRAEKMGLDVDGIYRRVEQWWIETEGE